MFKPLRLRHLPYLGLRRAEEEFKCTVLPIAENAGVKEFKILSSTASLYIPLMGNTEGEFKVFTLLLCVAPAI